MSKLKYKIRVANIEPAGREAEINKLNACIGISINNVNYWHDEKLKAIFKWIDSRFNHCTIVIGDDLHRHNVKISENKSLEEGSIIGEELGNQVLKKITNALTITQTCSFTILRWKELAAFTESKSELNKIYSVFETDKDFKAIILKSAQNFLNNQVIKGIRPKADWQTALQSSCDYILEETAYFGVMAALKGYPVQVYPGEQLEILKMLAQGAFPKANLYIKEAIFVDLKVRK